MVDTGAAAEKMQEADKNMQEALSVAKKNKYVKKIPTEIKEVTLADLLKLSLLFKAFCMDATYLLIVFSYNSGNSVVGTTMKILQWLALFTFVADMILDVVAYFLVIPRLVVFMIGSAIIKNIAMLLLTFKPLITHRTIRLLITFSLFALVVVAGDVILIYYTELYLKSKEKSQEEEV